MGQPSSCRLAPIAVRRADEALMTTISGGQSGARTPAEAPDRQSIHATRPIPQAVFAYWNASGETRCPRAGYPKRLRDHLAE